MTEQERDAHLREALRHAPDAQLQPPPALSAFILSEARAKARDAVAPARPVRHPLATLWDWLARPSVAAGFAGVMAATLVGLMWWDQPMDEALPRRPAPAAAPAPAPAPTPKAATPPVAQAPAAPRPAALDDAPRRVPEPPRTALGKAAPEAEKKADKAVQEAASTLPVRREDGVPQFSGGAAGADRVEAKPAPAVLAPAPAPAAPAAATATAQAAAGNLLAKEKVADESKRLRSLAPAGALSSRAAAQAELSESRARQVADARPSIGSLRAAIAAEPARWAWQRMGSPAQDMNDAVYAWLAQLETATGTSWNPRAARETAAPLGRELRLLRDGRVLHTLQITEGGVLWEREQSSWQAALPLPTLQALEGAAP